MTSDADNTYKCAACGGVFEKAWTDEEALAETADVFGSDALAEPLEAVCDDCFEAMKTDHAVPSLTIPCWWWLSFCDAERPAGLQFLGVSIVGPADNIGVAAILAHGAGCNPGGEVQGIPIPDGIVERTPDSYRKRLLNREEILALEKAWTP